MVEIKSQEGWISLPQNDFENLLDVAAQRGAERCLAHLGLENGHAARDIRELRDLLEAWRDARRTAWQTTINLETAVGEVQLLGNAGSIRVYVELGGSPNG